MKMDQLLNQSHFIIIILNKKPLVVSLIAVIIDTVLPVS